MGNEALSELLPLAVLVEDFVRLDRDAWLAAHPDAMIVFDELGPSDETAGFQTLNVGGKQKKPAAEGEPQDEQARILGRLDTKRFVFPLRKQADKFACMITVGRVATNTLRLNIASVSKFHAYLTHVAREDAWYLADANSSNGTFLDGAELPPSHGKVPLRSGAHLRFGPDVTGNFYTAAGFWDLLQRLRGDAGSGEYPALDAGRAPGPGDTLLAEDE